MSDESCNCTDCLAARDPIKGMKLAGLYEAMIADARQAYIKRCEIFGEEVEEDGSAATAMLIRAAAEAAVRAGISPVLFTTASSACWHRAAAVISEGTKGRAH